MRFNAKELATLALQPSHKFDKEGVLRITEKQEGLFRKTEERNAQPKRKSFSCIAGKVSSERWCRLRGNLLFYFKTQDRYSEPQGVIVLEKFTVTTYSPVREQDGFVFYLEFFDGLKQRICCNSDLERSDWIESIKRASYEVIRTKLHELREQIEKKRGNRQDVDVETVRIQQGKEIDIHEVPICEASISCDNLLCDGNGKPPMPSVVIHVRNYNHDGWIKYGRTEIVDRSSNPQFMCTFQFRAGDGLNANTRIRFTAFDVREKVSKTAVPLGYAEIVLCLIQETTRIRIPLMLNGSPAGFVTIVSWAPEENKKTLKSPAKKLEQQNLGHRRSQSLPPKLGIKLFVPVQGKLHLMLANPTIRSYRFQSGLGGDISAQEWMMESQYTFLIPQQLLTIWILREKELLQEISGIGELGGEWRNKQMDLLDKHLKLLKDYSQAKQNLKQCAGKFFKASSKKADESLEFAPLNLHLQRMWAYNNTLKRSGVLDILTVGAFTRHNAKTKTGGLIKLIHQLKESPSKPEHNMHKVQAANDAVQSIKELRREIVEIMSQLLSLAKGKNSTGMLPLCNQMIMKTRTLLTIWEPTLVKETFEFIETHRIVEDTSSEEKVSPFKKITQQLGDLDLKSPYLEDFATPSCNGPIPDLWPKASEPEEVELRKKSPDTTKMISENTQINYSSRELMSCSLPPNSHLFSNNFSEPLKQEDVLKNGQEEKEDTRNTFTETHFDVSGDVILAEETKPKKEVLHQPELKKNTQPIFEPLEQDPFIIVHNGAFLDTNMMSSCPSANYYRPTEEPEPLDLTQLNIEASVMCLVSKIKFLCGLEGSPAVRLRQPKTVWGLEQPTAPDVISNQPITTTTPDTSEATEKTGTENPIAANNLALSKAMAEVMRKVRRGNKFTDGLDLSLTTDWASELRPSMKKLRQAMDGLLKTARLMHSVQMIQQDGKKAHLILSTMYRRDVCFSQALTALITGLMVKLWGTAISDRYINILCSLGPIVYFEGLLSLYGIEVDMFGDMTVAIEDLATVNFRLVRGSLERNKNSLPLPKVTGSRQDLNVHLPIPESLYYILSQKGNVSFKVTPIFFNIGINEKATIAETLNLVKDQHNSNRDNFDRLKQYHIRFRKLTLSPSKAALPEITNLLDSLEESLSLNVSKNIRVLHLVEDITRGLDGLRFTSCKSAKDRSGMAVTLEQCRLLQQEFHLPSTSVQTVLDVMRSEGTRCENTKKNIGLKRYAFNLPQVLSLPNALRPPAGSYGKAQK